MAQTAGKVTYPVIVSFQSFCCGVPSDAAVRNFIQSFKKKYQVDSIGAYHIGPMGREGEYYLAFELNELSKKKACHFISGIKKIKPIKSDRGKFSIKEEVEIDPETLSGRTTTKAVKF